MDRLPNEQDRLWYAQKAVENGWSSGILDMMIASRLIERQGKAVDNFGASLPPSDSDMARGILKDPYLFDFIGAGEPRREAEVERLLTTHIEKFLLELGQGFPRMIVALTMTDAIMGEIDGRPFI